MQRTIIAICLLVAACAPGQPPSKPGQLFCQFQAAGGGTVIVGLIDAAAPLAGPGAAPVAILATNMGKSFVDGACAQAAANQGGTAGTPVSPPAAPVGNVAVNAAAVVKSP